MARVLLDTKEKELRKIKSREGMKKVMKSREELLREAESGLSKFSKTFLGYKKAIREARNLRLKSLLVGKEPAKLIVLAKLHILKEQKTRFGEKTITEVLETIGDNPSKYSKSENLNDILIRTMKRNLKRIHAYESLSERGKKELVEQLAEHPYFDRIISDSDEKSYWMKRIIRKLKLKELK